MSLTPDVYERQVASQVAQYASPDEIHDLPPIFHFWSKHCLGPKVREALGVESHVEFYAKWAAEAFRRTGRRVMASVGSGDAAMETAIAAALIEQGETDFMVRCFELSPMMVEAGRDRIARLGLQDRVEMVLADVNRSDGFGAVGAVMANQSLHHMVELEALFDQVAVALSGGGLFITCDMIGRNGHRRWPETLSLIRDIWSTLPPRLKRHRYRHHADWFDNWDCSISGFEGVRAQDIVPVMTERLSFEALFTFGGLTDIFTDRDYGQNLDPEDEADRAFILELQRVEDELLAAGWMTPTQMWAACTGEALRSLPAKNPVRLIRRPDEPYVPLTTDLVGYRSPYPPQTEIAPPYLRVAEAVSFGSRGQGEAYRRWGWEVAEDDFVWGSGESSAIAFRLPRPEIGAGLEIKTISYGCEAHPGQRLTVKCGDRPIGVIEHTAPSSAEETLITVPAGCARNGVVTLEFWPERTRLPDIDGGDDQRPLSFALASLTLTSN